MQMLHPSVIISFALHEGQRSSFASITVICITCCGAGFFAAPGISRGGTVFGTDLSSCTADPFLPHSLSHHVVGPVYVDCSHKYALHPFGDFREPTYRAIVVCNFGQYLVGVEVVLP